MLSKEGQFEHFCQEMITDNMNYGFFNISRKFWEIMVPEIPSFACEVLKKYTSLVKDDVNLLPYLLEMHEKYPEAPDILLWLANEYREDGDYLKALQIYAKLVERFPTVKDLRLNLESCKIFMLAKSMPEKEDTLQWIKNQLKEIRKIVKEGF